MALVSATIVVGQVLYTGWVVALAIVADAHFRQAMTHSIVCTISIGFTGGVLFLKGTLHFNINLGLKVSLDSP